MYCQYLLRFLFTQHQKLKSEKDIFGTFGYSWLYGCSFIICFCHFVVNEDFSIIPTLERTEFSATCWVLIHAPKPLFHFRPTRNGSRADKCVHQKNWITDGRHLADRQTSAPPRRRCSSHLAPLETRHTAFDSTARLKTHNLASSMSRNAMRNLELRELISFGSIKFEIDAHKNCTHTVNVMTANIEYSLSLTSTDVHYA